MKKYLILIIGGLVLATLIALSLKSFGLDNNPIITSGIIGGIVGGVLGGISRKLFENK